MLFHMKPWIKISFWISSLFPHFLLPISTLYLQYKYILLEENTTSASLAMQNLWLILVMLFWFPFIIGIALLTSKIGYFLMLFTPSYILVKMLQNFLIGTLRSDRMTKNLSEVFSLDDSENSTMKSSQKSKKGARQNDGDFSRITESIPFGNNLLI